MTMTPNDGPQASLFHSLGQHIYQRPLVCIGVWIAIALITGYLAPSQERLQLSEPASLLPEDAPVNVAMGLQRASFTSAIPRSQIVMVFHRAAGLQPADERYLDRLARTLQEEGRQDGRENWRVKSAKLSPFMRPRLRSEDGQASMVVVELEVNFLTQRAAKAVERVEHLVQENLPQGLTVEVTGDAAIGREHNNRAQQALDRTTQVTVVAVLVLLALVYRSPLGALVPLLSIGLSVYIAFRILDFLALAGWSISNAERTFTVVLLFGAGIDYALFWISRYREEMSAGRPQLRAAVDAMAAVGPAILASAGTTIVGLSLLAFADMVVTRNSGKVLGLVLSVSLLAAMTLTPAMAVIFGRALFWPGRLNAGGTIGQRALWPRVAADVVKRPSLILACGILLLAIPAYSGLTMPVRYDSFGEVPQNSTASRGLELAAEHFSPDALFSFTILLRSPQLERDADRARSASDQMADALSQVDAISDLWHLDAPLGRHPDPALDLLFKTPFARSQVEAYYFAGDAGVLQMEIMQKHPPLSSQATDVLERATSIVEQWSASNLGAGSEVFALGLTPYSADVKAISDRDLDRIIVGVTIIIWLIVVVFVRRIGLSVFMLLATLITYAAALGVTDWLFVHILGSEGIDFNIRLLVFVIIVAVGQDYNIFLVTRIRQEIRSFDTAQAIVRSIIVTGPVISSCGLIMAATLGSICTTDVELTQQLGFAFAAGILLDTFLVRPLLIPSYCLISERLWPQSALARSKPIG